MVRSCKHHVQARPSKNCADFCASEYARGGGGGGRTSQYRGAHSSLYASQSTVANDPTNLSSASEAFVTAPGSPASPKVARMLPETCDGTTYVQQRRIDAARAGGADTCQQPCRAHVWGPMQLLTVAAQAFSEISHQHAPLLQAAEFSMN